MSAGGDDLLVCRGVGLVVLFGLFVTPAPDSSGDDGLLVRSGLGFLACNRFETAAMFATPAPDSSGDDGLLAARRGERTTVIFLEDGQLESEVFEDACDVLLVRTGEGDGSFGMLTHLAASVLESATVGTAGMLVLDALRLVHSGDGSSV